MSPNNQNFVPQTPDLNLWLRFAFANFAADINCVSIGTINSFDATTQTATVAINYLKVIKGANPNLPNPAPDDQTSDVYLKYPLLIKCPVVVLQGGGSYLTFPIKPGDNGIVFFNDRELDTWLETGQTTYPHNLRTHDLTDAIILIGINPFTKSIQNYNTSVASLSDDTGERLTQAGFLQPYAGSAAPSGWLLCYGQAVSRTTYASLFAIIGTTYGSGNGTSTFNVPDLRGRTVAGLDNMGGVDANVLTNTYNPNRNILGGDAGEEAHQLTVDELASHDHNIQGNFVDLSYGGSGQNLFGSAGGDLTDLRGGDSPHQNVQPTLMVNWIIKA